jgi:hypothetical protein
MEAYEFIEGHQLVTETFGSWPSFHDAEVHRVVLHRHYQGPGASVELVIHGWVMTSEVTPAGHYKLEHESLIHFLFEQVSDFQLDGLNHQNVLFGLEFNLLGEQKPPLLMVELCHCYGLSGSFKASNAKVLSVTPYTGS